MVTIIDRSIGFYWILSATPKLPVADCTSARLGFVLSEGVYTPLDVPGAASTQVFSVNNRGEIVGSYDDSSGVTHGFLGTPVHAETKGAASAPAVPHLPDRSGG